MEGKKGNLEWLDNYPEMPEIFHEALIEEINKNLDRENVKEFVKRKTKKRTKKQLKKWLFIPAAVILMGVTVMAATHFRLFDKIGWRILSDNLRKLVNTEMEVSVSTEETASIFVEEGAEYIPEELLQLPDSSPLLEIKETLFDGIKLYIYATATDNGKKYDILSQRIYINGEEKGPMNMNWNPKEPEEYVFEIDLSEMNLTNEFQVMLPLSVYEKSEQQLLTQKEWENFEIPARYENQNLEFTVDVADSAKKEDTRNQTFEHEEIILEVLNITRSATTFKADFYYHISEDMLERLESENKHISIPELRLLDGRAVLGKGAMTYKGPGEGMVDGYYISGEFYGIPEEESQLTIISQFVQEINESERVYEIIAEDVLELNTDGVEMEQNNNVVTQNGIEFELRDTEIVYNISETEIKPTDFSVSKVVDNNGLIIPDELTSTDALMIAEFEISNIDGETFTQDEYILLDLSFQCSQLEDKNIGALPMVLLMPHGSMDGEGKEYNRLYLGSNENMDSDKLLIEKGQQMIIKAGFLVNREWLNENAQPHILISTLQGIKSIPVTYTDDLK